jgi:hypothetical protein
MAIPAHPSADRPRSAAEPARHSRRTPESNSGKGYRSEPASSIDQSPSVQRLRAVSEMMNPPASVAQTKAGAEEDLAASINQSPSVQTLRAISEMMNSPAPMAQTKQRGLETLSSRGLNPSVTQLKWIAGSRPNLLMWDKLVDGAQWYYTLPDGRMFYSRDNHISDVLPRQGWLEKGASELEDDDGEVVDVRDQPVARSKEEALQPWRIVIREAPSAETFTEAAKCFNKEWGAKPAPKRNEKGQYECSGEDWTQVHEGVDVSEDLAKNPKYSEPEALKGGFPSQYVAFYAGGDIPIALMMLAERQELPNCTEPSAPHLYIRWLVGSPDRRGGGGALVEYAKIVSRLQGLAKAVSVESAKSAVKWYEDQGYRQVAPSTHEHPDHPCKCIYLAWPPKAAVSMHEEHTKLLAAKEARKKGKKGGSKDEAEKSGSDEDD